MKNWRYKKLCAVVAIFCAFPFTKKCAVVVSIYNLTRFILGQPKAIQYRSTSSIVNSLDFVNDLVSLCRKNELSRGRAHEVSNGACFANVVVSEPSVGVLNHIMNKLLVELLFWDIGGA